MTQAAPMEAGSILGSQTALESFIAAFLDKTYPGKLWRHREHIVMAGWHLLRYSEAETLERIREGIQTYNVAQGGQNTDTSGYHETLTIFWIRLIAYALASQPPGLDEVERLRRVADEFGGQSRLYLEYYNFDVPASTLARRNWVEPDKKPLP